MGSLITHIQEADPFNFNQYPHLTKCRPKFNLIILSSSVLFLICITLMAVEEFSGEPHPLFTKYVKVLKYWDSNEEMTLFQNMNLTAKIMPSKQEQSMVDLIWSADSGLFNKPEIQKKVPYNESFFYFSSLNLFFPTFNISESGIPYPEPASLCFHLESADNRNLGKNSLTEQPWCVNAYDTNYKWKEEDPKSGIDIKPYRQKVETLNCSNITNTTNNCTNVCAKKQGFLKKTNSTGLCYTYSVLSDICFKIRKTKIGWEYIGGCYKDGFPALYVDAAAGKAFNFANTMLLVRDTSDPLFNSTSTGTYYEDVAVMRNYGIVVLSVFGVSLTLLIGCAIIYICRGKKVEPEEPSQG